MSGLGGPGAVVAFAFELARVGTRVIDAKGQPAVNQHARKSKPAWSSVREDLTDHRFDFAVRHRR